MSDPGGPLLLADTSVWARMRDPRLAWFGDAVADGRIAVCDQVAMELLWSARDVADFVAIEAELAACPWLRIEPRDWEMARRIFRRLAEVGPLHHRRASIPDLLIAAVAFRHALPVLHYDADYDTIAAVTGGQARWVVPRGTF